MRKPRNVRFTVSIINPTRGAGDLPGFLDMLRYEGGRVVDWNHDQSTGIYKVTIEVDEYRHVPARWQSFGIFPELLP